MRRDQLISNSSFFQLPFESAISGVFAAVILLSKQQLCYFLGLLLCDDEYCSRFLVTRTRIPLSRIRDRRFVIGNKRESNFVSHHSFFVKWDRRDRVQHYRRVPYDSHVREISDCCDDRPFYWCGGQSVATHASRDRQTVVVRLCVVRPHSSLFHLSYDLIMTIECGRRRHPGGSSHTAYTETVTKRARPGPARPRPSDPLCPIDRRPRRSDLAATDRCLMWNFADRRTYIGVTFARLIAQYTVAPPAGWPAASLLADQLIYSFDMPL